MEWIKRKMNKKADERLLSIYLFIIYIIIAVGIISGVLLFYGPLDVRSLEAGILSNKVIDCLVEQGIIKPNVLDGNFDLLKECGFDFIDNSEIYGDVQYGVKVKLSDFDTKVFLGEIFAGNQNFLEYCGVEGEKIPKCNKKALYILDREGSEDREILMEVSSAVSKVKEV